MLCVNNEPQQDTRSSARTTGGKDIQAQGSNALLASVCSITQLTKNCKQYFTRPSTQQKTAAADYALHWEL